MHVRGVAVYVFARRKPAVRLGRVCISVPEGKEAKQREAVIEGREREEEREWSGKERAEEPDSCLVPEVVPVEDEGQGSNPEPREGVAIECMELFIALYPGRQHDKGRTRQKGVFSAGITDD